MSGNWLSLNYENGPKVPALTKEKEQLLTQTLLEPPSFNLGFASECKEYLEAMNQPVPQCDYEYAVQCASRIMDLYPSKNVGNPETFIVAVVEALLEFPRPVVTALMHPRHGIASQSKFVPSLAEIVNFCEILMEKRSQGIREARERLAVLERRERLARDKIIIDEPQNRESQGFQKLAFSMRSALTKK